MNIQYSNVINFRGFNRFSYFHFYLHAIKKQQSDGILIKFKL